MISVLLACCERDQNQAIMLLEWIAELDFNQTELFILCSDKCNWKRMEELGRKSFATVKWLRDHENLDSNWHEVGNHVKSAQGPNSLFTQAAWHFHISHKKPWLFLEPDAIPTRRDWLQVIDKEYYDAGRPFLGFRVERATHPGDVGVHMSGVAVYHPDLPQLANRAVTNGGTAFDIEGAEQIVPQMANSRTIFHRYRPPTFSSQEDFETRVPSQLAIYHACKDGSIYQFLRQRLGIKGGDSPCPVNVPATKSQPVGVQSTVTSNGAQTFDPNAAPVMDIFIKTRLHDYPWLEWCLRSINVFTNSFRRRIVVTETGDGINAPDEMAWSRVLKPDKEPGYLWQQVCKLHADQHTDAEYILYQDSDTIFTRPVSPSDFIKDGKPIWLYTPLDQARPDQHVWAPVMEKFLGKKPEHEFMRRHPFCVQRWMLEELRTFCKYKHGRSLEDYIMAQAEPGNDLALTFSEWNCLGFFLWEHHRDKVHWVLGAVAGPACCYQGFTHGGEQRKQEDLAKFRELLSGSTDVHDGMAKAEGVSLAPPPLTMESAIQFIADNVTDNFHKARVTKQLHKAWKGKGNAPRPKLRNPKLQALPEQQQQSRTGKKVVGKPNGAHLDRVLLCIHSYPGANEAIERHWPNFCLFGADRIVGIGTTDGKCTFPCQSVNIGENAYMKMKGKDDHLCRRLLDTIKWCLTQPEDRFAIIEYDTLILKRFPKWKGVAAWKTGGQVNGSKTAQFFHNPWLFDRESAAGLIQAMEAVLPESEEYPDNSPDLFFGLACERAGIKVSCPFKFFTRNSLDQNGDLEEAAEAARSGVHAIHGVKHEFEFETIMRALNEQELELSHAQ